MTQTCGLSHFEREARATAGLKSPHTVQTYDFGVIHDGRLCYVMELLDGMDLELALGSRSDALKASLGQGKREREEDSPRCRKSSKVSGLIVEPWGIEPQTS
jgi:serine/threonine protein kinase